MKEQAPKMPEKLNEEIKTTEGSGSTLGTAGKLLFVAGALTLGAHNADAQSHRGYAEHNFPHPRYYQNPVQPTIIPLHTNYDQNISRVNSEPNILNGGREMSLQQARNFAEEAKANPRQFHLSTARVNIIRLIPTTLNYGGGHARQEIFVIAWEGNRWTERIEEVR